MDQSEHLESKEDLQRRMSETRYSMAQTLGEIRDEFSGALSWETYVQRYPGACLLIAGGIGWAIGNKLAGLQGRDASTGVVSDLQTQTEPSGVSRMAELIAASVFAQVFPLLAEKMKQVFRGTEPL